MAINGTSRDDRLSGDLIFGIPTGDEINGFGGDDELLGVGGSDTLRGGAGADTLNGGQDSDIDWAAYDLAPSAVEVSTSAGVTGEAAGDILISITGLIGSRFDDTLRGGSGREEFVGGEGGDILVGGRDGDTLRGGSGNDTVAYEFSSGGVFVQLDDPALFRLSVASGADAAGDRLTSIENLIGSPFDDTLIGNIFDNLLDSGDDPFFTGRRGDDALSGLGGDDTLDGGVGDDTLSGGDGDDFLISGDGQAFEGAYGEDSLDGGPGNDTMVSGFGPDVYNGGSGRDRVVFDFRTTIDLTLATQFEGSRFISIEDLEGTSDQGFNPDRYTFRGSSVANRLTGGPGDDTLEGRGGADTLDGGAGIDTVSYASAPSGVTVRLADLALGSPSLGSVGDAAGDQLVQIERLTGSDFRDVLTGNSDENTIRGGEGADDLFGEGQDDSLDGAEGNDRLVGGSDDDTLLGGDGADLLEGGSGNDRLIGGPGSDTLDGGEDIGGPGVPFPLFGGDTARFDDAPLGIAITLRDGADGSARSIGKLGFLIRFDPDVLRRIENAAGSDFDDTFRGNSTTNVFQGRDGDDRFFSDAGNDFLFGGDGADTLDFSAANLLTARADLALLTPQDTGQGLDSLSGIENLFGGASRDTFLGSTAVNVLTGGAGDDTLTGRGGDDTLVGGADNDTYDFSDAASFGSDVITDVSGLDTARFDFRNLVSVAQDGNDLVATLTTGAFRVVGHFAGSPVETAHDVATGASVTLAVGLVGGNASGIIAGGDRGEVLDGRGGDDLLYGNGGRDELLGGSGDDLLDGGAGRDTLVGGRRDDRMVGGEAADLFVIEPRGGHDVIADFGTGADRIDLTAFDTSFRALDTNGDRRLGSGEGDRTIEVRVASGDTILTFKGGSLVIENATQLSGHDFVF